ALADVRFPLLAERTRQLSPGLAVLLAEFELVAVAMPLEGRGSRSRLRFGEVHHRHVAAGGIADREVPVVLALRAGQVHQATVVQRTALAVGDHRATSPLRPSGCGDRSGIPRQLGSL